jgi:hypothetical protein
MSFECLFECTKWANFLSHYTILRRYLSLHIGCDIIAFSWQIDNNKFVFYYFPSILFSFFLSLFFSSTLVLISHHTSHNLWKWMNRKWKNIAKKCRMLIYRVTSRSKEAFSSPLFYITTHPISTHFLSFIRTRIRFKYPCTL